MTGFAPLNPSYNLSKADNLREYRAQFSWSDCAPVAKSIPKPSFLDRLEPLGAIGGERRWRSKDGKRLYTWDALHGEIEVFNARGRHLGVIDPLTGEPIKDAVRGRKIDV